MWRLIVAARAAGIRVGVLSNEFELFHGPGMLERIDVMRDMDAIVDATHTKILKPDLRAYQWRTGAALAGSRRAVRGRSISQHLRGGGAGLQTQHFDLRDVDGNIAAIAARLKLVP